MSLVICIYFRCLWFVISWLYLNYLTKRDHWIASSLTSQFQRANGILVLFPCLKTLTKWFFNVCDYLRSKIFVQCAHYYWNSNDNWWQQYSNVHEDQYCLNIIIICVKIFRPHFMESIDTNIYAIFVWNYSEQWLQKITCVWKY